MRGGEGSSAKSMGPASRIFLLLLLLSVYIHNQWTRNSIVYAVNFAVQSSPASSREYMNIALGFDASQYGMMASYGFTLLYTMLSLLAGRVADTTHKGKTLALACSLWSGALILQGLCTSFYAALACRIVQGFAMAFTGPQALSLLADAFPSDRVATATSIYTSGVYFGAALASLSMLANSHLGWRLSFSGLGGVGCLLAAAVALFVSDKHQPHTRSQPPTPTPEGTELLARSDAREEVGDEGVGGSGVASGGAVGGGVRLVRESVAAMGRVVGTREVQWALLAGAVRFCAGYGVGVWSAPMFRARFPGSQAAFAASNALIIAAAGFLSSLSGGLLADRFGGRRARLLVPAGGCFLAVPAILSAATASHFPTAMVFLFGHYLVAECWIGPFVSFLTAAVPPEVRGSAQALVSMLTLVGNAAPLLIGFLYSKAGLELGAAFLWCVCSSYMLSGSLFVIAALRLAPAELTSPESSAAQLLVEDERGGDEDGGEGEDAAGAGTSKV